MLPGTTVTLSGEDYIVPPLNLRVYYDVPEDSTEKVNPNVTVVLNSTKHTPEEYTAATLALFLPTIQRNYPTFDRAKALEVVGYADCPGLVMAMLTKAGFKKKDPLESPPAAASAQPANPAEAKP